MDTRIAGSCWWHVGLDTPRNGVEKRMGSPRPQWAGGAVHPALWGRVLLMEAAVHPALLGRVLLMKSCWVGHPALLGRVEKKAVG